MADWVPRRGHPLVFHGVVEEHDRADTSSGKSKSIFNAAEVDEAVRYVMRLRLSLDDTQIGVLCPYKLQVQSLGTICSQIKSYAKYRGTILDGYNLLLT